MTGGGFFTDPRKWDDHVRALSAARVTLDRDGAVLDLRYHQDAALNPFRPAPFPTSGDLAKRWNWSKSSVYRLLCRWREWADPEKLDAFEAVAARWNGCETGAERERHGTGTIGQRQTVTIDALRNGGGTEAERERNANGPARAKDRVTDHRSPSTDHTNNTHGSPTEPPSRPPDGSTDPSGTLPLPVVTPAIPAGPADGGREGNTREPSVARNASAPRGGRAAPGGASAIPDDVLGALAEIDAKAARRVVAGKSEGLRAALSGLVKAIGEERTVRRLRYVARFPADSGVRWWRDHGASLSAVLRAGTPLASGFDVSAEAVEGTAAARLEAPTVGDWRAEGWRPDTLAARATPVTQDPAWVAWRDIAEPYIRESRRSRKPPAGPVPPEVERVVDRIGGWAAVNNIAEIADVGAALRAALKEVV